MKKINLLHLITSLGVGGAEKVVLDLTLNADNNKFDVHVASLTDTGDMLPIYRKNGIDPFLCLVSKSPKGLAKAVRMIRSYVKNNNISIIHAHMFHSLLVASLVKVLYPRVKIVFTPHNISLESLIRELVTFTLKPLRENDILFSELEKVNYYNKNRIVIPNGIQIQNQETREKFREFTFISVGAFRPAKNYVSFIKAFKNFKFPIEFRYLIAGKGPEEEEIKNAIKYAKMEDQIILLGLRNDINEWLQKSHVFLMPSLWEGMPIALLEAGVAALPVLATPVGNIPKLITKKTGYLAQWEDFQSIMKSIYLDYNEAQRKGKELRRKIEKEYSIESIVNKHEELYKKVLNR